MYSTLKLVIDDDFVLPLALRTVPLFFQCSGTLNLQESPKIIPARAAAWTGWSKPAIAHTRTPTLKSFVFLGFPLPSPMIESVHDHDLANIAWGTACPVHHSYGNESPNERNAISSRAFLFWRGLQDNTMDARSASRIFSCIACVSVCVCFYFTVVCGHSGLLLELTDSPLWPMLGAFARDPVTFKRAFRGIFLLVALQIFSFVELLLSMSTLFILSTFSVEGLRETSMLHKSMEVLPSGTQ